MKLGYLLLSSALMFIGLVQAEDKEVQIEANATEWLRSQNRVIAKGTAKVTQEEVTLEADTLKADFMKKDKEKANTNTKVSQDVHQSLKYVQAEGSVHLRNKMGDLFGAFGFYDLEKEHVQLRGKTLKMKMEKGYFLNKDQLDYWPSQKRADILGQPHGWYDGKYLEANQARFYFDDQKEGQMALSHMKAEGHIFIVVPPRKKTDEMQIVKADHVFYNAKHESAQLKGSVKLIQGQNYLQGDEAFINLKTGEHILKRSNSSSQPVYGLLISDKKKHPLQEKKK
jgi:lipopolysaccharide export system protein LptA